jgi:hypothetical protein
MSTYIQIPPVRISYYELMDCIDPLGSIDLLDYLFNVLIMQLLTCSHIHLKISYV